jgi:hypothetical protein
MTYGCLPSECSGYAGSQSFWLDYGKITEQLKALESPLHCLRAPGIG